MHSYRIRCFDNTFDLNPEWPTIPNRSQCDCVRGIRCYTWYEYSILTLSLSLWEREGVRGLLMGKRQYATRDEYGGIGQRTLPSHLLRLCREFRKHPTRTEEILWTCLRNGRFENLKFRRQHPIGRYIADFFAVRRS